MSASSVWNIFDYIIITVLLELYRNVWPLSHFGAPEAVHLGPSHTLALPELKSGTPHFGAPGVERKRTSHVFVFLAHTKHA